MTKLKKYSIGLLNGASVLLLADAILTSVRLNIPLYFIPCPRAATLLGAALMCRHSAAMLTYKKTWKEDAGIFLISLSYDATIMLLGFLDVPNRLYDSITSSIINFLIGQNILIQIAGTSIFFVADSFLITPLTTSFVLALPIAALGGGALAAWKTITTDPSPRSSLCEAIILGSLTSTFSPLVMLDGSLLEEKYGPRK